MSASLVSPMRTGTVSLLTTVFVYWLNDQKEQ